MAVRIVKLSCSTRYNRITTINEIPDARLLPDNSALPTGANMIPHCLWQCLQRLCLHRLSDKCMEFSHTVAFVEFLFSNSKPIGTFFWPQSIQTYPRRVLTSILYQNILNILTPTDSPSHLDWSLVGYDIHRHKDFSDTSWPGPRTVNRCTPLVIVMMLRAPWAFGKAFDKSMISNSASSFQSHEVMGGSNEGHTGWSW